jgi:hypothetical protein
MEVQLLLPAVRDKLIPGPHSRQPERPIFDAAWGHWQVQQLVK